MNYQGLENAAFARLATDAAGAPLRALLPDTGRILQAPDLRTTKLAGLSCVLKIDPVVTFGRTSRMPSLRWFVYDDPVDYSLINAALAAIEGAYATPLVVAGQPNMRAELGAVSDQHHDQVLDRYQRTIQFVFYTV